MGTTTASYKTEARDRFRDADVLLFSGNGLSSLFIRLISWSRYSHVGLVMRQRGRVLCAEATGAGVHLVIMSELTKKYDGRIDYYEWVGGSDDEREEALGFIIDQLGKPYDFGSGLRFAFALVFGGIQRHVKNEKWFCSELVAKAFEVAGMDWFAGRKTDYISPKDLKNVKALEYRHTIKK